MKAHRSKTASLDHLIDAREQHWRYSEAKRLRGLVRPSAFAPLKLIYQLELRAAQFPQGSLCRSYEITSDLQSNSYAVISISMRKEQL